MIAGDAPNPTTQRVTQAIVSNQRLHERVLKQITGRDPDGEGGALGEYLREAFAAGDPWLLAALTGRSAFDGSPPADAAERLADVDPGYVSAFLRGDARAGTE